MLLRAVRLQRLERERESAKNKIVLKEWQRIHGVNGKELLFRPGLGVDHVCNRH